MSGNINPVFVPDKNMEQTNGSLDKKRISLHMELNDVKADTDKDYDPYKHRKVDHPTTNADTLLHLLKGSLGTGILSMPIAFFHAGYLVGIICTLLIGLLCTYCVHILIKAEYELCKRKKIPSLTYPGTAEAAFLEGPPYLKACAPYTVHIVNTFLVVYQLGSCCVYIVFIATNVKYVMDQYIDDIYIGVYMLALLLPLILLTWIKNLKLLAPFSTFANVITVVSFGITLYYIIIKGPTFEGREAVGEIKDFPLYFGTVLFALEAIGVIMPLENEMKTPKAFGGVFGILNIGMGTIIALYIGMGFLGYLSYGSEVESSITLNLEKDEILAQVVRLTLALAIFITYALQFYVAIDITWNEYLLKRFKTSRHKNLWEYVTRTLMVLLTFILAVAVPHLDLFISLFGALCLAALGLAFPALIDLATFWHSMSGRKFIFVFIGNILIVIFGICGLVAGTGISLLEIIKRFQNTNEDQH